MNEELQLALSQLIEKSMVGVEKSVDFLSAEIPDVIYQLLMWYGVESALYTLFGVILGLALIPINRKLLKLIGGSKPDVEKQLSYFVLVLGNAFYIITMFKFTNLTWLQIWIAPKVWLLDYASNFIK